MARVIAVVNQKGGVGKTTTAVNLAASLHRQGRRVLLADLDPQGNATTSMGVSKARIAAGSYDVLIRGAAVKDAAISTPWCDLLAANRDLAGAGVELVGIDGREHVLEKALDAVRGDYDYILIDCPPSLELLTVNSLCAADRLLIPVQCEYFALEGLSDLMSTVRILRRRMNPRLEIEGVLLTMFDGRTNLSYQVAEEVKRFFDKKVFRTAIPRNVRLSEAPSHGVPVLGYDAASKGTKAYLELANEIIRRDEGVSA